MQRPPAREPKDQPARLVSRGWPQLWNAVLRVRRNRLDRFGFQAQKSLAVFDSGGGQHVRISPRQLRPPSAVSGRPEFEQRGQIRGQEFRRHWAALTANMPNRRQPMFTISEFRGRLHRQSYGCRSHARRHQAFFLRSMRISFSAARLLRLDWTSTSRTSPSASTARRQVNHAPIDFQARRLEELSIRESTRAAESPDPAATARPSDRCE